MPALDPLYEPQKAGSKMSLLRIAIVCDFFYPRLGGVEAHIYSLAQCLVRFVSILVMQCDD